MRVLLVGSGNICRTPVAELLLREHWAAEWELHISSAGTEAHVDSAIYTPMRKLLVQHGLPDGPFSARQLTPAMVQGADLVLGMTREHRSTVVVLHPRAVRTTFTLREFARVALAAPSLTGDTAAQRLSSLLPIAARMRGSARVGADDDAIKDPYGRGESACMMALDQIEETSDDIVGALAESARGRKS